ncbi:MAG: hypothetical protein CBC43_001560 [Rhizobiales bacterium TMED83]|mgnify:CR=1 FL=1|nr:hypothetical protein [Rhodobiaceae bacterium]RPF94551.1 MAG: hypothetical protein CBC43_001560 [Rhizobiales bacterium TMED83]
MKIIFATALAAIASLGVSSTVHSQEYAGCPEPDLGFQEYKTQLADCMSDGGRKLGNRRLDRLLEAPVEFNLGVTFDAVPAPNEASRFSKSAITQEGLRYRDIGRLVVAQPDSIFGIHTTLVENLRKYQLNKVASPIPYDVLKSQMLSSFAQTLPLVGQSASSVKPESQASKAKKADGAEGEAEVSGQETKSEKKANAQSEQTSSKQISASSRTGAIATGGNSVYAIVGGLGVAAAAGGGGGGGGSSCPASASIAVSLQTVANFSEAASSTITATSSAAPCSSISVSLIFSGQAIAGTDYQDVSTIVIPANQTNGSIELAAIDDSVYEGDETIVVDISAVDGGIGSGAQQQSFLLQDNETLPTVTLATSTTSLDEKTGIATLTATASGAADENMVVTLSGSGTAVAGTDYTLPTITIPAGSLTGTATFTPIDDTSYETTQAGVAEIATLDISSVTIGAENGSQSVSISITERALNSGTQLTYNSTNAETRRGSAEFSNFNASTASSAQNPLETINAHKAHGYGLNGSGETVMVMDSCMNQTHPDLQNPTISAYGTVDTCNGGQYHGVTVAGVIAADVDNGTLVGVAPGVDLVHAQYSNFSNSGSGDSLTLAQKWAAATDYARTNDLVVQNNSWGPSDTPINTLQTNMSNLGTTALEEVAVDWRSNYTAAASDASGSAVQTYVTALNNYQDVGVVVFALSNTNSLEDADVIAALPVLFTELNEAWITAVNIEVLGPSGLETYERKSAPCGQTAAYCLGADAWEIAGLADNNNYIGSTQGTSFVAPMISGAVAILAEAFPNHTPEQLVDRLLASADNSWFTPDGNTAFANGVVHGYNTEFGHGILDIYAALQPITSNSNVRSLRVYSGQSNLNQPSNSFGRTALRSSRSFGDGIYNALAGTNSFVYDDMNGGFVYDLAGHISQSDYVAKSINLSSELQSLNTLNLLSKNHEEEQLFSYELGSNKGAVKYSLTRGNASLPVQNFLNNENTLLKNLVDYETPYLSRFEDGIGLSAYLETDQRTYFFGYNPKIADDPNDGSMLASFDRLSVDRVHEPFPDSNISSNRIDAGAAPLDDPKLNTLRRNGSFAFGFKQDFGDSSKIRFITGLAEEDNGFLGLSGSGAFTLDGAETSTAFTGVNFASDISPNLSFGAVAIYANSEMFNRGHTMLSGVDQAVSNSFGLNLEGSNIWGSDRLEISLAQPNRIQEGSMRVRVTNLADAKGNLTYRSELVGLEPSGRQIDLSVGYAREVSSDFVFSTKLSRTSQLNHVRDADDITSAYLGVRYKNLLIGASTSAIEDEFLVHWSHRF